MVDGDLSPKKKNDDEIIDPIFSLLQIPHGVAAKRSFGGSFWKRMIYKSKIGDKKKSDIEDATNALTELREDAATKKINKKWQDQTDNLMARIFNGKDGSIKTLTRLFEDGKMIFGSDTQSVDASSKEHTQHFQDEKAIARAFYAQAIPAVWTLKSPAPVVVDFGPSCKIDARKYFSEKPSKYNVGWECPSGHSYILSGVRERRKDPPCNKLDAKCGIIGDHKPPLSILEGIGELKAASEQWGHVSTNDLIIGVVNRYNKNGKKNDMDPKDTMIDYDDVSAEESFHVDKLDIRRAGFIRIPVCGPEEVLMNLRKGKGKDWKNYPCNP